MKNKMHRTLIGILFVLWSFLIPGMAAAGAACEMVISSGQTIYVPVYSHIYSGDREHPFYLAVTLSIRNTDPKHTITLLAVDYYDSDGKQLRSYLKDPINLDPFGSTRYVIKESDKSGGSGANFIVKWKSDVKVNAPITESVMIGTKTQQGISFISRGRVIGQ